MDAASRRRRCGGEPRRSPAMHVNVTSTICSYRKRSPVHSDERVGPRAGYNRAWSRETGLCMMKYKVTPAGMGPAEVGGEQSASPLFENLIFALNY